jgi:heat shock protein HslJ
MSRVPRGKPPALRALGATGGGALWLLGAGCAPDQSAGASDEPAIVTGSFACESTEPAAPQQPLTGRGNEPGWSVTIGADEIELVADYGATRAMFPKPAPETSGEVTRYVVADAAVTITLLERPCADSMSGMFYPLTVTVERPEGVLSGCGGEAVSLLLGPAWVVESIDGTAISADSRVTIAFHEGGRIDGLASCNRYLATYELTGEGLAIRGGASTMMACEPSLMEQERRFLDALAAVRRFEIAPDGALVLLADGGPKLIARR